VVAYRVYFLDGVNRFMRAEAIEAASDEDVVRQARPLMCEAIKCEIWDQHRVVARVSVDAWPE
jgi:hypothetical protein